MLMRVGNRLKQIVIHLFRPHFAQSRMQYSDAVTRKLLNVPDVFDDTCTFILTDDCRHAIERGKLKISIIKHGDKPRISRLSLTCGATSGVQRIQIGANDTTLRIGSNVKGVFTFQLWRDSSVVIGDKTTCNGARFICDRSSIVIGEDCMFSDSIIVQSSDQHGLVDLKSGQIYNQEIKSISVGDHVWIGRTAHLLHGSNIGSGSVIGFGALVTSHIPANSLAVGTPARAVKSHVTWSRTPEVLDDYASNEIQRSRDVTITNY